MTPMAPITVVLADPHPAQRRAVRTVLDAHPRLHVLAAAGHREAASELVQVLEPDAIVIDVGLLACSEFPLSGWGPISHATRLVGIGPRDDDQLARWLRRAGFAGYVPAARLSDDLADAVIECCAGMPA